MQARGEHNSEQAQRLLTAVVHQGELGKRMVAFFACIYYAARRILAATRLPGTRK
jgi:hypothetical protein